MSAASSNVEGITGISSMAMRGVLAELCDAYEQQSGQLVAVVAVGGVDAARRVADGEMFDFVVLATDAIEKLASKGHLVPGSRIDLARSDIAIAVAAGARQPDVGSEAAIRDAVSHARSIGYSTGPSGAHVVRLLERWGLADVTAPRLVQAPPGVPVGTLVARGDVELGFQQLSELMHVPGIDVVGRLPPELKAETLFSAALCSTSQRRAAAHSLLAFLASPEADAAKHRHGMEPARPRA